MPLIIEKGDITNYKLDAIVNAANTNLLMGSGVCGAIFKKAGVNQMQKACDKLAPIKTGDAVITDGFNLNSKYVIHTAGPIYDSEKKDKSKKLLELSYINSLKIAKEKKLTSIAFPLISSGIYGYPKEEAKKIAIDTINQFLKDDDMLVYLVLYDG